MELMPEQAAAHGVLRVFRRPEGMPLDDFLRAGVGDFDGEFSNLLTNLWWQDAFNLVAGYSGVSLQASVLSLGTGSLGGGAARTDTTMVAEWRRYPVVSVALSSADPPSVTVSFFAPASDGAVTLTEAGLFHASATLVAGTGRLGTHAAFAYVKPNNQDVRIDYAITRSTSV